MGITNTISELSNYFYQWHKNKYDEIHQATVDTQNNIYETIFGPNGIKDKLDTLKDDFDSLLNRYNTLVAGSTSTIHNLENDIANNKNNIATLSNNKADKTAVATWTQVPLENSKGNNVDVSGTVQLWVNSSVRLARLTGNFTTWNNTTKHFKSKFFIPFNKTPSTGTDYGKLKDANRIYIKVPDAYRPKKHAATAPLTGSTIIEVWTADGYVYFSTHYSKVHTATNNGSVMWHY